LTSGRDAQRRQAGKRRSGGERTETMTMLDVRSSPLTPRPDDTARPGVGLSARESEVILLVAEGLRNNEIAMRLSLSEETVKSHIRHGRAKLGAHTRAHAVALVLRSTM
jgi:DNA-binding CsgD family transcriptional regulator